jgi:hypothetical protein
MNDAHCFTLRPLLMGCVSSVPGFKTYPVTISVLQACAFLLGYFSSDPDLR